MKLGVYVQGSTVHLRAKFRLAGVLTDPTTVIFTIKSPARVLTSYTYPTNEEVVRESAGVYYVDFKADKSGEWHHRFEGTGAVPGVAEDSFSIIKSRVIAEA